MKALATLFSVIAVSQLIAVPTEAQPVQFPQIVTTQSSLGPPTVRTRQLCSENVLATTSEIHWQLIASTDSPEAIIQQYIRQFGQPNRAGDGRHLEIRGPNNLVISVYPASEIATHPHCQVSPNGSEQTLLLVSIMHRFS